MTKILAEERRVFTVTDLTRNIRFILEEKFSNLWVEGEISSFKLHSSGHMYFSLKDEESQIQCVMFRGSSASVKFEVTDGLKVMIFGRVSVYAVRGNYQLYVERMEPKGLGALQLAFLQLKEKLQKEGLFDTARKKEIPYLPERIGIVTSIDGAALRDILHVLDRRFPDVHVLIYPVPVQGKEAALAISRAIDDFNEYKNVDVLIVGRGGGSLEDLWAFNEEVVARAIDRSKIPVISAVGHEVDFTIADFVADIRAATPSAAAEIVLPRREDLLETMAVLQKRLFQAFRAQPEMFSQRLDELKKRLAVAVRTLIELSFKELSGLMGKLEVLGPLSTLRRGFSVTLKEPGGAPIVDARSVRPGDRIRTRLAKGFLISKVE